MCRVDDFGIVSKACIFMNYYRFFLTAPHFDMLSTPHFDMLSAPHFDMLSTPLLGFSADPAYEFIFRTSFNNLELFFETKK